MDILPNKNQLELYLYLLNYIKSTNFGMGYNKYLYIDGGNNKNSKYEQKSNNLQIAVIAKSEIEAKILLVLLRIIVDRDWNYIDSINDPNYDYMYNFLSSFLSIIHLEFNNVSTLSYKKDVILNSIHIKKYTDIDVWDYSRIKKYFTDILYLYSDFLLI